VFVSPSREHVAICPWRPHLANAELAAPALVAAGLDINPRRHELRLSSSLHGISLFQVRTMASEALVTAEPVYPIGFSPDSRYLAYAVSTPEGVRLHWRDCLRGKDGVCRQRLHAVFAAVGEALASWLGCSRLLTRVPACARDEPFDVWCQESARLTAPDSPASGVRRRRVAEHFESQLAVVDVPDGCARLVGEPDVYRNASGSPDGRYILVHRCQPSSRLRHGIRRWAARAEVWDAEAASGAARVVYRESGPSNGDGDPQYGSPGRWYWHPLEPAMLVKLQTEAPEQSIVAWRAPFTGTPEGIYATRRSVARFGWTSTGHLVVEELDSEGGRMFITATDRQRAKPAVVVAQSIADGTVAPGASWRSDWEALCRDVRPLWTSNDGVDGLVSSVNGALHIVTQGVDGRRRTAQLRAVTMDSDSGTRTLYEPGGSEYERIEALLGSDQSHLLLAAEDADRLPFRVLVDLKTGRRRLLDSGRPRVGFSSGVIRRVVAATADGETLVCLPPGAKAEPQPLLLWIQPYIGRDAPETLYENQYLRIPAMSPLRILRDGIRVAHHPPIPLCPFDSGDRFVTDLVNRVHGTADALVAMGLADPERLVLGGHCIGAYATVLVLTHSRRFKAGIASGGKYNLAATPLGGPLTGHKRLWDAPSLYIERSPLNAAKQIETPLLLVHGEHDRSIPSLASEELFQAVNSAGGRCRFVCLPNEGHVYRSVEGTTAFIREMAAWIQCHAGWPDSHGDRKDRGVHRDVTKEVR
jgi:dipeptidyl aminopeptidase/acylaminoacyl peptidase